MNQTSKDKLNNILDQIDNILVQDDQESQHLWGILTALRGPDSNGEGVCSIKQNTTSIIRAIAFPKTAELAKLKNTDIHCANYNTKSLEEVINYKRTNYKNIEDRVSSHFMSHIEDAVEGMKEIERTGNGN